MCAYAAQALRIKESYGTLHMLDARNNPYHPLLHRLAAAQIDLDEGMVIYDQNVFHHGPDALTFMALHGSHYGWFNRVNAALFASKTRARMLYPVLRAVRNMLVRIKGVGRLDNLNKAALPVFAPIFGKDWDTLPAVMRKHYANRPYTDDLAVAKGTLTITASRLGRALFPLFRLLGMLVAREGKNVSTTVRFITTHDSNAFHFDRQMTFDDGQGYRFHSLMRPEGGNAVTEVMRCQLGWRMRYVWNGSKVLLLHRGYALNLFGWLVPLPLTFIIGRGYAEETPIDDDSFSMMTEIRHPLWGQIYSYRGTFTMQDNA